MAARECLMLGCSQAGKTILLRRLSSSGKGVNLESAPTVRWCPEPVALHDESPPPNSIDRG